ncbi:hypothetical protein M0812_12556 [Anaeramoeba flamelloides]|uniref:CUE domain-containing protein n=1 Tax=Anaeramoeba flamelloides TaxID=1746091 RepID=A0AAV7ZNC7_9EUKA|nr:hypothetical protein M0812_12556 [Anaeramoeba flamelloides]
MSEKEKTQQLEKQLLEICSMFSEHHPQVVAVLFKRNKYSVPQTIDELINIPPETSYYDLVPQNNSNRGNQQYRINEQFRNQKQQYYGQQFHQLPRFKNITGYQQYALDHNKKNYQQYGDNPKNFNKNMINNNQIQSRNQNNNQPQTKNNNRVNNLGKSLESNTDEEIKEKKTEKKKIKFKPFKELTQEEIKQISNDEKFARELAKQEFLRQYPDYKLNLEENSGGGLWSSFMKKWKKKNTSSKEKKTNKKQKNTKNLYTKLPIDSDEEQEKSDPSSETSEGSDQNEKENDQEFVIIENENENEKEYRYGDNDEKEKKQPDIYQTFFDDEPDLGIEGAVELQEITFNYD